MNRLLCSIAILIPVAAFLTAGQGDRPEPTPAEPPATREPLSSLWKRRMPGVVATVVSQSGDRTVTVDVNGIVSSLDAHGTPLWQQDLDAVNRVVTNRDSSLTLAYATRRPLHREVFFLNAQGRTFFTLQNEAPVDTVVLSPDGHLVAVAAGNTVTLCRQTGDAVKQRSIKVQGEPTQIQFGPGDSVYVATRNPDQVALVKSTGKVLWRRTAKPGADFAIAANENGQLLAVASERPDSTVGVSLISAANRQLWSSSRPGRSPRVRLASDGSAVLLAYEHKVEHQAESRFEQRLAYFGTDNAEAWTRGGSYNAPLCVSVDRSGDWVVVLDAQRAIGPSRFRLFGERGERRWLYTCDAPVLIAAGSPDGRHIAVYRGDGVLEMLVVS